MCFLEFVAKTGSSILKVFMAKRPRGWHRSWLSRDGVMFHALVSVRRYYVEV